ncbi:fungal-specific transcription factor domain-containing protein [Mycena capillaripes]|nr:fungal-specific transcription factor domain-containing protein [Mycena capillaripes]
MPAAPKSPQSKKQGAPKAKGAVRAKSGCYTCRIRRKVSLVVSEYPTLPAYHHLQKCDEHQNQDGHCETCVRLRLQCLGFGAKRPEWLRESRNVSEMRDKIKGFLAAQGMIKGHSGTGHHALVVREPPTPTLSLSPSEAPRALPHMSAIRDQREWLGVEYHGGLHPHNPMRTTSPLKARLIVLTPTCLWTLGNSRSVVAVERPRLPAISSSFSPTYHAIYEDDMYYPPSLTTSLEDDVSSGLASYSMYPQMKPGGQMDDLLNHYLKNVMGLQYLLVDDIRIRNILQSSVTNHGAPRNAARLLSAVHVQLATYQNTSFVALQNEDIKCQYDGLLEVLRNDRKTEDDALAALSIISSFLFDGGRGPWQDWLGVSYDYAHSVFRGRDPRDALQTCGERTRFIIKTAIWFDVLAAITTQESPRFLHYIRQLYSPEASGIYDPTLPPSPELSMMSVMGCENHIVWALAEASALSVWKRQQQQHGCLSIPELVTRANNLDKTYLNPTPPPLYPTGTQSDTEIARELSSNIFRTATRVYVRSIVSGDFPHVPEIVEAIDETMAYVRKPQEHSLKVHTSVVRSTVFAFFICGALTDKPLIREEVNQMLCLSGEHSSMSTVGNSPRIRKLLEKIWENRAKSSPQTAVPWRETLRDANMLLV